MRWINQALKCIFLLVPITGAFTACATIPELTVKYQMPASPDRMEGRRVFLAVEDSRESKSLMLPAAEREFRGFGGSLTLTIARPNEGGFMVGIFEPTALVREVFKRRLMNMGLEVDSKRSAGEPELLIALKELNLDIQDMKWVAKMGYEAKLMKDGELLAAQTVNGRSERLRVFGRNGSDEVMGEIFTDVVNKLSLAGMFQQGRLLTQDGGRESQVGRPETPEARREKARAVVIEDLKKQ